MTDCLWVEPSGEARALQVEHTQAHTLFQGSLTMVGAVPELGVFATGLRDPGSEAAPNVFCTDPSRFHDLPVHGPVLFVGIDAHGEPCDVDTEALLTLLRQSAAGRLVA